MSDLAFNSVEFDGIKPLEFEGIRKQAVNMYCTTLFYLAFPSLDAVRLNLR